MRLQQIMNEYFTPAKIPDFYSVKDMLDRGYYKKASFKGGLEFNTSYNGQDPTGFRCKQHKRQLIYDLDCLGTGDSIYFCPSSSCHSQVSIPRT